MASIDISDVRKSYGRTPVLHGVDLNIEDGEFVVLVGPSGCGKSTLLRMIAGLEEITDGDIAIAGRRVNDLAPKDRDIAMVFQSYALYPHMTVYENMAFGLEQAKLNKAEADTRIRGAAEMLQITPYLNRKPRQLSGGQRQRVAIGRAITRQPRIFLFDEPLSNLDAALRVDTRIEIAALHKRMKGVTMIYVTHDQVEAMTLADRIVVLNAGHVEQVGTPMELYMKPASRFVAEFIGSPRMNVIEGEIADGFGASACGIRPEHLAISREDGLWSGKVLLSEELGSDTYIHVETENAGMLNVRAPGAQDFEAGERVFVTPDETALHRFDAAGTAI